MTKTTRWLVAAALLAVASSAHATNGMRMIGFGPVQNSMGGVSVGAPLDGAVVITNPAGMNAVGGRIDFGATYFTADVNYKASAMGSGQEVTSDRGASPVPAFGLVMRRDEKLSVGIGAYGIAGMGVDYPPDLFGANLFTSYSQMRFAPGFAYAVLPNLSVGVVANLMYATMEYNAAGMQPRDSSSTFGAGATVGVTYTPIEQVTIGAAYETRSWFQDFKFNIPPHTTPGGDAPGGVEKLDFDQPSNATFGVGVRPLQGLLLAADVQWIRWSETNGKNDPQFATDPQLTGIQPWNLNWDDQVVIKVGAQYVATEWLAIRAGYNYGKSPLSAERYFENLAFPAIAEHHVTGGLGFTLGKTDLNVGMVYVPEATLSGTGQQMTPGGPVDVPYETRMSQLAFDVGLAYRF